MQDADADIMYSLFLLFLNTLDGQAPQNLSD
jgi:hypothetical protein